MPPVHRPGDNVLNGLHALGLKPEDIDVVVNSHLHMDHCGCNEFFRKATFIMHARELAAAGDPAMQDRGYFRADWDHPMPVEAIEGERDIFDDNRIVLLPLPGHTPGSMGAMAELEKSGRYLLAADALSVKPLLTSGYQPRNNWNNDEFQKSLERIRSLETGGATVVCGHDDAQWSAMRKGAAFYD